MMMMKKVLNFFYSFLAFCNVRSCLLKLFHSSFRFITYKEMANLSQMVFMKVLLLLLIFFFSCVLLGVLCFLFMAFLFFVWLVMGVLNMGFTLKILLILWSSEKKVITNQVQSVIGFLKGLMLSYCFCWVYLIPSSVFLILSLKFGLVVGFSGVFYAVAMLLFVIFLSVLVFGVIIGLGWMSESVKIWFKSPVSAEETMITNFISSFPLFVLAYYILLCGFAPPDKPLPWDILGWVLNSNFDYLGEFSEKGEVFKVFGILSSSSYLNLFCYFLTFMVAPQLIFSFILSQVNLCFFMMPYFSYGDMEKDLKEGSIDKLSCSILTFNFRFVLSVSYLLPGPVLLWFSVSYWHPFFCFYKSLFLKLEWFLGTLGVNMKFPDTLMEFMCVPFVFISWWYVFSSVFLYFPRFIWSKVGKFFKDQGESNSGWYSDFSKITFGHGVFTGDMFSVCTNVLMIFLIGFFTVLVYFLLFFSFFIAYKLYLLGLYVLTFLPMDES